MSAQKAEIKAEEIAAALNQAQEVSAQDDTEEDLSNAGEQGEKHWLKKWLVKRGLQIQKPRPQNAYYIQLQTASATLLQKAKDMQTKADLIKAEGNKIKKRAKKFSRPA